MLIEGKASVLNNNISFNELRAPNIPKGAGIFMHLQGLKDTVLINGNTFLRNIIASGSGWGAGLCVQYANAVIAHNNIFSFNSNRNGWGGGMCFARGSHAEVINNTLTKNEASYGGGLYSSDSYSVVINTILWNNRASSGPEVYGANSSINVVYSDIQGGWSGEGNINADPAFADTLFHLSETNPTSPCINTGIDALQLSGTWYYCPPHDIAGHVRPHPGTAADMGAYETDIITAVAAERSEMLPEHFALHQNYPNPFNPETEIHFQLPKSSHVVVNIYNLAGQKIRTLTARRYLAGTHSVRWDGKDESGVSVPSGIYFYQMRAGDYSQVKKMTLL